MTDNTIDVALISAGSSFALGIAKLILDSRSGVNPENAQRANISDVELGQPLDNPVPDQDLGIHETVDIDIDIIDETKELGLLKKGEREKIKDPGFINRRRSVIIIKNFSSIIQGISVEKDIWTDSSGEWPLGADERGTWFRKQGTYIIRFKDGEPMKVEVSTHITIIEIKDSDRQIFRKEYTPKWI